MTAASYTTDLTDITTAESTTGWSALGGGASGLATNADSSMQGTYGIGKQITGAEKGQVYGSGGTTISSGRHVYTWIFLTTPGLANTLALRGLAVVIGSSTTAYCQYHVEGNDTYGAAGRVGKCYPVDPSVYTSNTGSSPYRTVTGSPSGTYAQFGATANITGTIKGENLVVDAIRHGTGVFITLGDATPNGPATFSGMAAQNDANAASPGYYRWGIFTSVSGSYELQGRLHIGYDNTLTPTQTLFVDSNVNIVIPDNPHVASNFNAILFAHASTDITWNNVSITSFCSVSPGTVDIASSNPAVAWNTCVFTDMAGFTLRTNTLATSCTFRRCQGVSIVNGGALDTCLFDEATVTAVLLNDTTQLANVQDCTFISDGTGHAIDFGTVTATTSVNWNNYATGYVTGSTGSPVTTGTSGNECIRVTVNSGQTLTINVGTGYTVPSVKNDGTGSVNVVAGQVTLAVHVQDVDTAADIAGAQVLVFAANNTSDLPYQETVTSITNTSTTAVVAHTAHGMQTGDKVLIEGASLDANNGVFTITVNNANEYQYTMGSAPGSSPTGTILATWVAIYTTTDSNGDASLTRSLSNDQPVAGRVRKGSASTFYKTSPLSGVYDSASGLSLTVQMIPDE